MSSPCHGHEGISFRSSPQKPGVTSGSKVHENVHPPTPRGVVSRNFLLSCWSTLSLQQFELLFKCSHQLASSGASTPGKQICVALSLWLCHLSFPGLGVVVCPSSSTFLLGSRKIFDFQQRRKLHSCPRFGLLFNRDLRCDANESILHLFRSHLCLSLLLH